MPAKRNDTRRGTRLGRSNAPKSSTVKMTDKEAMRAPHRTNFARLDAMTDDDIAQQIADNPDAAPDMSDALVARVDELLAEPKREQIALKVESDILAYLRAKGPGYQTRINAVLRAYVEQDKKRAKK